MNTAGALSGAAIAMLAFGLGLYLHHKKRWLRAVPWLMLIAGFGLGGLLGRLLNWLADKLLSTADTGTRLAVGVGVPLLLALLMGLALWFGMGPKAKPTRWTPFVAVLFPSVLLAMGGPFAQAHAAGEDLIGEGTNLAWSAVLSLGREL